VDVATGKEIRQFNRAGHRAWYAALSRDGKTLATGGRDGEALLWDTATGKLLYDLKERGLSDVRALALSGDGKTLAACSFFHPPVLWDARTGKRLLRLGKEAKGACCVAFSPGPGPGPGPGGKLLASGGHAELQLWEAATGKLRADLKGHGDWVRCVTFSPDGKLLASAGEDGVIRVWDVASGKEKHPFAGLQGGKMFVGFLIGGRTGGRVVTVGHRFPGQMGTRFSGTSTVVGHSFSLWELDREGRPRRTRQTDLLVGEACLSPDGKVLAHDDQKGAIRLLDPASGKELRRLAEDKRRSGAPVAFSPDSKLLAAEGREGAALWDVKSGRCLHRLIVAEDGKWIHAHVFSPDGKLCVLVNNFGARDTVFWYTNTGERVELPSGTLSRYRFAFSASGRWLAVLSSPERPVQEVHLLESATGQVVWRLRGRKDLTCCAVSPDGRLLVSGGEDGILRVWDPASGKEVRQLRGHQGSIVSVAFAPDGKRLLSSSADTTVLLWDLTCRGRGTHSH
jgi:WD40 repeat protein